MAGMVVCPQPEVAELAVDVLRRGGNAVDAAVTAAFAQGVVDPNRAGIGGCGAMLVHDAGSGRTELLEFWSRAGSGVDEAQWERRWLRPAADRASHVVEGSVNEVGYGSIGVPTMVAGMAEALRRWGTISWRAAIAPSISLAGDGCAVTPNTHSFWDIHGDADTVAMDRRIAYTPAARELYTKDGGLFELGDRLVQPALARTLERLASAGPDDFYSGELAAAMAADLERGGATVTAGDLRAYRPGLEDPLRGTYRGLDVLAAGPPAGGVPLLQMLNYLEGFDVGALRWPGADEAALRLAAMAWAFADRDRWLADPRFADVPVARLLDKAYADEARRAGGTGAAAVPGAVVEHPDTTQVTVVDGRGGAVSLTQTLGAFSGVVTRELGFGYNNYLNAFDPRPGRPNSLAPGKARITMMTPTMVLDGGRLRVAIGSPGGTRIAGAILQTLLNVIDHGMDALSAVAAPRVDVQADVAEVERRVPADVVAALTERGWRTHHRLVNYDNYFARPQLIAVGPDGALDGGSDPRGDGGVALWA